MIVGMDTTSPIAKIVELFTAIAGQLQRNGTERQNRRHPEADEQALLVASREPERHGQHERSERRDKDDESGTATKGFTGHGVSTSKT